MGLNPSYSPLKRQDDFSDGMTIEAKKSDRG
jgi:hypothetical protein